MTWRPPLPEKLTSSANIELLPGWAQQMCGDFWGIRSAILQALEAWASALAANQELKEENERLRDTLKEVQDALANFHGDVVWSQKRNVTAYEAICEVLDSEEPSP